MASKKRYLLPYSGWKPKAKSPEGESHEVFSEVEREAPTVILPPVWETAKGGSIMSKENERWRIGKAIAKYDDSKLWGKRSSRHGH